MMLRNYILDPLRWGIALCLKLRTIPSKLEVQHRNLDKVAALLATVALPGVAVADNHSHSGHDIPAITRQQTQWSLQLRLAKLLLYITGHARIGKVGSLY